MNEGFKRPDNLDSPGTVITDQREVEFLSETVVFVSTNDLGEIIVIPQTENDNIPLIRSPELSPQQRITTEVASSQSSTAPQIIPTELVTEQNIGQVISIPAKGSRSTNSIEQTFSISSIAENSEPDEGEGQVITVLHEETIDNVNDSKDENTDFDPQVLSVLSQHGTPISDDGSPLSFIALVPGTDTPERTDESPSFVALIPDSTHYAPPISTQEDECSLTLKEITAREKSRLIKRVQRQNSEFREKERKRGRLSMKDRRKDPEYREMERKRDRERRRLARQANTDLREKERERDREYRRRLKIQDFEKASVNDIESQDSLECFMKDIDEKCQLLINCKGDESSNEEIVYNFNNSGVFDDGLLGSSETDQNNRIDTINQLGSSETEQNERIETIGQYGNGEMNSGILLEKDSKQNDLKNIYNLGTSEIT